MPPRFSRRTIHQNAAALLALSSATLVVACSPAGAAPGPTQSQSAEVVASAESLRVGDAVLRGTLLRPGGSRAVPVALIIAGSGPTDRDGNNPLLAGRNYSLRMLAEGLADQGIASLRFDKRGVGESSLGVAGERDLSVGTFVDDAVAWGRRLRSEDRFPEVVVIGHSEGGMIGILAAPRVPASKVVSVAGLGRPGGVILREQLGRQLTGELFSTADSIIASLERGTPVSDVPPVFQVLFRPSVQPYLMTFLAVDPAAEAAKLNVPLLVIHGTTDEQMGRADADALAASSPWAALRVFEGMNHVLKPAGPGLAQQLATAYVDSTIALVPGLVDTIAAFIKRR